MDYFTLVVKKGMPAVGDCLTSPLGTCQVVETWLSGHVLLKAPNGAKYRGRCPDDTNLDTNGEKKFTVCKQ